MRCAMRCADGTVLSVLWRNDVLPGEYDSNNNLSGAGNDGVTMALFNE